MALVLIGFMGAGKSTVASELAQAAGVSKLDTDALLEERFGHPVAREFELHGEQSFRASEEALVCEILDGAAPSDVIALGGGSVLSEQVRKALGDHVTVMLDVSPDVAWARVRTSQNGDERPLARDRDAFTALHAERQPVYEGLADAVIGNLRQGAAPRTLPALRALATAPRGTRMLWASAASGDYPVFVRSGLLDPASLPGLWPFDVSRSRPFCVSDENVVGVYGLRLPEFCITIAIPPGEEHKTLASAERVWQELASAGMRRSDHIVALGGGVVGDLAGFCAATYQRGVPVLHVPTTLVAQVDSAYGGKTGVDLPQAKNYVGAYHQPAAVLVDPNTLATLPPRELAAGWVEVLKTALIVGGSLWERVAGGGEVDERVILDCARAKIAIVAADERDAGSRQALNLGHTVGHAIETATGYSRYLHGEAVGLGLLAALRLSGLEDLRAQVRELLLARELPTRLSGTSVEEVLTASERDKKRVGEVVPFVLLDAPGSVRLGVEVPTAELEAAISELLA